MFFIPLLYCIKFFLQCKLQKIHFLLQKLKWCGIISAESLADAILWASPYAHCMRLRP